MRDRTERTVKLKYYFRKMKDVQLWDYISIIPMSVAFVLRPLSRKKYKNTWLISERKNEAQDNGYYFFRYLVNFQKGQDVYYAINKRSADYIKVKNLGKTVRFGSVKHWLLYFNCKYIISSQDGTPAGYLCAFLERSGIFVPKHVFLQHGITKDRIDCLLANRNKLEYFITSAYPEFRFVEKYFGYPKGTVRFLGFPRYDMLHNFCIQKNRVLIMPTWRKWLNQKSEKQTDIDNNLMTSDYIHCWKEFLNNEEFISIIKKNNLEVYFYPHPNMKNKLDVRTLLNANVKYKDENLQELLKTSSVLITDYSSVFFDMIYMRKPVIFYQFDEKYYRKYQYQKGWFDYHTTPFGKHCIYQDEVYKELERLIACDYRVGKEYLEEHKKIYPLYDGNNSERIYNLLCE